MTKNPQHPYYQLTQQLAKFGIVGIVMTIIGYVNFAILNVFFSYTIAYIIAFIIGIILQFILQSIFVFSASLNISKIWVFAIIYGIQFLMCLFGLKLIIEYLGLAEYIAYILMVCITAPITFILNKLLLSETNQ